ncbi:hypothetical protein RV17_GL001615 [Enterococcus thailandicus]|nr:hypothetical protein RV17_GL001615 [Enterococcus thailandicus]
MLNKRVLVLILAERVRMIGGSRMKKTQRSALGEFLSLS